MLHKPRRNKRPTTETEIKRQGKQTLDHDPGLNESTARLETASASPHSPPEPLRTRAHRRGRGDPGHSPPNGAEKFAGNPRRAANGGGTERLHGRGEGGARGWRRSPQGERPPAGRGRGGGSPAEILLAKRNLRIKGRRKIKIGGREQWRKTKKQRKAGPFYWDQED